MEILQSKISSNHDNAIFYSGVIGYGLCNDGETYLLKSETISQITMDGNVYLNEEITKKALNLELDDDDVEDYISVDGWLVISKVNGKVVDDYVFGEYDEAVKEFKTFLRDSRIN